LINCQHNKAVKKFNLTFTTLYRIIQRLEQQIHGGTLGANLKIASEQGFVRRQNHPLAKLVKSLTAESQDAIDELVRLMKNSDSEKIRKECAIAVLEALESASKTVENDAMMRLMANAKFGGPKPLGYDEDDDSPEVDFSVVQQVE
jgi:DNA-binding MarR family transcriptional regulator